MSRSLAFAVLFLASVGCKDSLYCEKDGDCSSTQQCDVTGSIGGIGHTCVADPTTMPDANTRCDMPSDCSGSTPVCNLTSGICVECVNDTTCTTAEEPVCTTATSMCSGCTEDGDCAGRTDGRTSCDMGTGICQVCVDNGDCATATTPICDATAKTCRGCGADAECAASGVCNTLGGNCVPEADVIYVDKHAAPSGAECTKAAKCLTVAEGLAKVSGAGSRTWILITPGVDDNDRYPTTVSITNKMSVVFKGEAIASRSVILDGDTNGVPTFSIADDGVSISPDVRFERIVVTGATNAATGDGIFCQANPARKPDIVWVGGEVRGNEAHGFKTTDCNLTVTGSTISGNAAGGVFTTGGTVTVTGSTISGNADGGVSLSSSNFTLVNNFIVENGDSGSELGGVRIMTLGSNGVAGATMEFNTLARNLSDNAFTPGLICSVGTDIVLRNNIVYGNPLDTDQQLDGVKCKLAYSNIGPTAPDASDVVTGTTLNVDPGFLATSTKPVPFYRLGSSSMCRDAADPAAAPPPPSTDFDGEPRVKGGRADMGADEVP